MSPTARTGPPPVVVGSRAELDGRLARRTDGEVALVPTMGALHAGHLALVATARERVGPSGTVVVSVFVNPMQFGPGEDLDRYPRTLEDDVAASVSAGADVVFAPSVEEVYPHGEAEVTVDAGPRGGLLEGASRPTHFRGVLTVVAKLLGLVGPDVAVFGEKDYQQLVLIRAMVVELCLDVDVVGVPTQREDDGLARSSRNRYLDAGQRASALALSRALLAGRERADDGADAVVGAARRVLDGCPEVEVDYLTLTDPDLGPAPDEGEARLLVAARVGSTRLLDNLSVVLGRP